MTTESGGVRRVDGAPRTDGRERERTREAVGSTWSLTPSERSLRARLAAYTMHSRYDSREVTRRARETFLARFEFEVDPDGVLPLPERRRRAALARKAYFTRLAFRSAQARRRGKAGS